VPEEVLGHLPLTFARPVRVLVIKIKAEIDNNTRIFIYIYLFMTDDSPLYRLAPAQASKVGSERGRQKLWCWRSFRISFRTDTLTPSQAYLCNGDIAS